MNVAYRKAFLAASISLIANPSWAQMSILPGRYDSQVTPQAANGTSGGSNGITGGSNSTGRSSSSGSVAATVIGGSSSVAATVIGGSSSGSVAATVAGSSSTGRSSSSSGSTGFSSSGGASTGSTGFSSGGGSSSVAATVVGGSTGSSNGSSGSVAATVAGSSSTGRSSSSVAATVIGGSTGSSNGSASSVAATVAGSSSTGHSSGSSVGGSSGSSGSVAATVAGNSTGHNSSSSVAATVVGGSTGRNSSGNSTGFSTGHNSSSVAATVAGNTTGHNSSSSVAATVAGGSTGRSNGGSTGFSNGGSNGHNSSSVAATVMGNTTGHNGNNSVAATVVGNTTGKTDHGDSTGFNGHNTNGMTHGGSTTGFTNGSNGHSNGMTNGHSDGMNGHSNGYTTGFTTGKTDGMNGHTNGRSDGYTNGHSTGMTNGHSDGYTNGHNTDGKTDGHTTGRTNGYTNGKSDGYTNGHTNGETNGHTNGHTNGETNGHTNGHTNGKTDCEPTTSVSTSVTTATTGTVSTATSTSTSTSTSTASTSSSTSGAAASSSTGSHEDHNKLKVRLEPLFHLSFDFGSYIVNLTPQLSVPQPKSVLAAYDASSATDTLVYGDYRDGFQKTVYGSVEVGLGAQLHFWFENATGILDSFWGYVGVLPVVGKDTQSTRYVSTLDKAYSIGGRNEIPESASDLDRWDAGDSITYAGHGGIIFNASAGFGPVGIGTARLAKGTWETYVEKVGAHKAYVKMTSGKLESLSVFASASILTISSAYFNQADDGFSYLFDLSTDTGRKAYEDMIRGNAYASEMLAKETPRNLVEAAPVQKVQTFRTVSSGQIVSKAFAIPIIWDKVYSKGRVQSFTTSDLHIARNTARVHYGIFSTSEDSRFWFKHKEKDFMFYGAKYSVDNWDTKAHMESMFGTYSYAFRHEKSNAARLNDGIKELIKHTGLDALMVSVPDQGDLGYTGVEFNVVFSDDNTLRLMRAAQSMSEDAFVQRGAVNIDNYFSVRNDPYWYCNLANRGQHEGEPDPSCVWSVKSRTSGMMSKMYNALRRMYKTMNSDPKAFAAAYGEFGEGMNENAFTFKAAMDMAGPGVMIDYTIEGTRISMYFRQWQTDSAGRWVVVSAPSKKGLPFDPRLKRSKARGVVIGNNPGDVVNPFILPVEM